MERIRQAVEQARKNRLGQEGEKPPEADREGQNQHVPAAEAATPSEPRSAVDSIDVESRPGFTEIKFVEVSTAVRERNRLVPSIPGHPMVDAYRMLRRRIIQEMDANNWKVIAVSSPATGSGKSLTAINLAIGIGKDLSHTAFLVDGDLRRPSIAKYFGYTPEYGVSDFLHNDVPLNKCLFRPDMDRLLVFPGREPISDSAETLASGKITEFIKEARSRYDDRLIVIDLAPVLSVDDALALMPNVDCMLIVAESGETKREDLAQALELLQGIPIIGTVLNKVDKKVAEAY